MSNPNIEYTGENEPLTKNTLDMFDDVLCRLASLDKKILSDASYRQVEDVYQSLKWRFENNE